MGPGRGARADPRRDDAGARAGRGPVRGRRARGSAGAARRRRAGAGAPPAPERGAFEPEPDEPSRRAEPDPVLARRAPEPQTIAVEGFVPLADVPAELYDKAYWLAPEPAGRRPYRLLLAALEEAGQAAICRFVLREREHLALVRSGGDVMVLQTLHWPEDIRSADRERIAAGVAEAPLEEPGARAGPPAGRDDGAPLRRRGAPRRGPGAGAGLPGDARRGRPRSRRPRRRPRCPI